MGILQALFTALIAWISQQILVAVLGLVQVSMGFFMNVQLVMSQLTVLDSIKSSIQVVAIAIMILVVIFQVFKSMFAFLGFEADEPWKIAMRTVVFGFMAYYAYDMCSLILSIFGKIMEYMWPLWNTASPDTSIETALKSSLIVILFSLYMIVKLFMLIIRFGERFMLTIILIVSSPLAFVTGVAKSTKGILQGWVKLFTGNLIVQMMQLVLMAIILQLLDKDTGTLLQSILEQIFPSSVFSIPLIKDQLAYLFQCFMVIAAVKVLERLEELLRDVSVTAGLGGGPLMGPMMILQQMNQLAFAQQMFSPVNVTNNVTREH